MKNDFLPKSLNGMLGRRACLNVNYGAMSTELHYHDCVEIIYVRRGAVSAFFDNGWHELSRGTLLFVPPGCIHRCVAACEETEQIVIGFTDDLICDDETDIAGILRPYRTGIVSTGYILYEDEIVGIKEIAENVLSKKGSSSSETLDLYSNALSFYSLIYAAWEHKGMLKVKLSESHNASEIKRYVSENFASKISARDISERLNISYSYLSKIMLREFGINLGRYVISKRIENAKKMLLSTDKSIAEIGYECGFASSSAFISHFKVQTGKTPFVFRNEARGDICVTLIE